jgi:hypothetical protein
MVPPFLPRCSRASSKPRRLLWMVPVSLSRSSSLAISMVWALWPLISATSLEVRAEVGLAFGRSSVRPPVDVVLHQTGGLVRASEVHPRVVFIL